MVCALNQCGSTSKSNKIEETKRKQSKFLQVYSVLKSDLLNDPAFKFTDDSRQWVDRYSYDKTMFRE
ncbi:hypothetical protein LguiB_027746 [Lonicera macranthoides]